MQNPHNTERHREKRRGLVKQTFELDEAAAADRSNDQVRREGHLCCDGHHAALYSTTRPKCPVLHTHTHTMIEIFPEGSCEHFELLGLHDAQVCSLHAYVTL